jgi:PPM family protein phosphatase
MRNRTYSLRVGFLSDTGRVRERNEDALALYLPYSNEESVAAFDAILLVADGMGGHEAGDAASRFVAGSLIRALTTDPARPEDPERTAEYMRALLRRVDRELRRHVEALGLTTAGSTATIAALYTDTLFVAHVGDSRLYRLRAGELRQMTPDHSWVADQVRAGLMTVEEAMVHPRRNLLTECLGIGKPPRVAVLREKAQVGDRYMLCSDGLHAEVGDAVITRALLEEESAQQAAARLAGIANEAGGSDNITVIVCDLLPLEASTTQPELRAVPLTGNGNSIGVTTSPGVPAPQEEFAPAGWTDDTDEVAEDNHSIRVAAGASTLSGRAVGRLVSSAVLAAGLVMLLGGGAVWCCLDRDAERAADGPDVTTPPAVPAPSPSPDAPATIPAPPVLRDTVQGGMPVGIDTPPGANNSPSHDRGDPR